MGRNVGFRGLHTHLPAYANITYSFIINLFIQQAFTECLNLLNYA